MKPNPSAFRPGSADCGFVPDIYADILFTFFSKKEN